eukprot:2406944-Prymnesium_polylepis.1
MDVLGCASKMASSASTAECDARWRAPSWRIPRQKTSGATQQSEQSSSSSSATTPPVQEPPAPPA